MFTVSSSPTYQTAPEPDTHSDDEDTPEALPDITPRLPSRNLPPQHLTSLPPLSNDGSRSQSASMSAPPGSASLFDLQRSSLYRLAHRRVSSSDPLHDAMPERVLPAYFLTADLCESERFVAQDSPGLFQLVPEPIMQQQPSTNPPSESRRSTPERPLSQFSVFEAPPPTTPM
ncbi:hypothetical protein EI94DRAFT_904171 [Lactarius quietus]|nr:hypothetical protein EI94DRAFT_904171 [Lactarius quietus]